MVKEKQKPDEKDVSYNPQTVKRLAEERQARRAIRARLGEQKGEQT